MHVTVLGSPAIAGAGPGLRAKSLELLVYLAAHDGQARRDAIIEDLLPDAPTSRAAARLHTYVWDLRHETLQVDLWRMRQAIHTAAHTKDPSERIAALRLPPPSTPDRLAATTTTNGSPPPGRPPPSKPSTPREQLPRLSLEDWDTPSRRTMKKPNSASVATPRT